MKLSLSWLNEFIDHGLSAQELADALTMSGSEVKAQHQVGQEFERIVVGEIVRIDSHPEADKLRLPTLNVGSSGEQYGFSSEIQVVCGAPNLEIGQKIAYAFEGAEVFFDEAQKERTKLKKARIRGVESRGMVCSERELGLGSDHKKGILVLPNELEPGTPLAEALGLDDVIFELEITPNRGDCLSVLGLAREISACTGKPLKAFMDWEKESWDWFEKQVERTTNFPVSIQLENTEGCPAYAALAVRGVQVKRSPIWLRWRLQNVGVRPINTLVDVTNYVMYELGAPQHAFDRRFLGNTIRVRSAEPGEKIITLDGQERTLVAEDLLIADEHKGLALAGIMGGEESEIRDDTNELILESAHFEPIGLRKTSNRQHLRTEGSIRWEKFVPPALIPLSLWRSWQLLQQLDSGGELTGIAQQGVDQTSFTTSQLKEMKLYSKMEQLLGKKISTQRTEEILTRLGFGYHVTSDKNVVQVSIPPFRPDVQDEADLVEEVIRIEGFDTIPSRLPQASFPPDLSAQPKNPLPQLLKSLGFTQTYDYSMLSEQLLNQLAFPVEDYLRIDNPLAEFEYMRTSHLPSLLATAQKNIERVKEQQLFELGKVFTPTLDSAALPNETVKIGLLLLAPEDKSYSLWDKSERALAQLKGKLEQLVGQFNLAVDLVQQAPPETLQGINADWLHPARYAEVKIQGKKVGWLSELHPQQLQAFDLGDSRVVAAEIEIGSLWSQSKPRQFESFSLYPSVERDISLVAKIFHRIKEIQALIEQRGGKLLQSAQLIDLYQDENFETDEVSQTWRLTYQSMDKTLTEKDVEKVHKKILQGLENDFEMTLRF